MPTPGSGAGASSGDVMMLTGSAENLTEEEQLEREGVEYGFNPGEFFAAIIEAEVNLEKTEAVKPVEGDAGFDAVGWAEDNDLDVEITEEDPPVVV